MNVFAVRTDASQLIGSSRGQWTAVDWEQLPADGHRYEIIHGVLSRPTFGTA